MARAYSIDLRERAVEHATESKNQTVTAKIFKVSRQTINEWVKRKNKHKNLHPKKAQGKPSKIDPQKLQSYVSRHPDSYLREIAKEFGVSLVAVHEALKRHKITRKKNHTLLRTRREQAARIQAENK